MEDSARGPDSLTLTAFVVAVFLGAALQWMESIRSAPQSLAVSTRLARVG